MSIKLNILSFMTCQQNCFSFNLHHTSMVKFMNLLLYCLNLLCILGTICQMLLYIHIYIYIYIHIYIYTCIIYIYIFTDIFTQLCQKLVIPCATARRAFTLRWLPAARLDCRPCARQAGLDSWEGHENIFKSEVYPLVNHRKTIGKW